MEASPAAALLGLSLATDWKTKVQCVTPARTDRWRGKDAEHVRSGAVQRLHVGPQEAGWPIHASHGRTAITSHLLSGRC